MRSEGGDSPRATAQAEPELVLLTGHRAPVLGAAFSPDGKLLATTGWDSTVILWETETGAVRRVWRQDHSSPAVAFTSGGESLVTSGNGIGFRNIATGRWEGSFPNVSGPMRLTPDGRVLIGTDAESFLVVESRSGQLLRRVPFGEGLDTYPDAAAISPDGSTAAISNVAGAGLEIRIWDLTSGELKRIRRVPRTLWSKQRDPRTGRLRITHGAAADVHNLALSPDGRFLAVGGVMTLWLCDTRTGRRTHLLLCGCEGTQSLAFSPDGTLLAAGTSGGAVVLWRVRSGEPVLSCRGHTSWVSAVAFSPDGKLLATGSHDKAVKIWRVDTGECYRKLLALDFQASGVAYSPDGARIAVSYNDGAVRLWNARTRALETVLLGGPKYMGTLAFAADGSVLSAGIHPTDPAWDTAAGRMLRPPTEGNETPGCGQSTCEALAPDGQMLAISRGWEAPIELRRTDSGELLHTLANPQQENDAVSLVFSADGKMVASGYLGFRARLWHVPTGKLLQTLRTHGDAVSALAFSPDGALLAVGGSYGNEVVLCKLQAEPRPVRVVLTREERRYPERMAGLFGVRLEELPDEEVTLEGHTDHVRGVTFSPDGGTVATVAGDAALRLWDPTTGRLLATLIPLPSLTDRPSEDWIAYTPEGHHGCSSGANRFIRLRDGAELREPDVCESDPGTTTAIGCVRPAPGGHRRGLRATP